jgi:hypothetical protein
MFKKPFLYFMVVMLGSNNLASAWGFWGHKKINRQAVFCLPPEMVGFYKKNIDYITNHAVDADKRRYSNKDEATRHYIDVDYYTFIDSIPKTYKKAIAKYTEDTIKVNGIVPWHINSMLYSLIEAFKNHDADKVLYYSANIGHYIADAHVPLHTTENYNGQLTNQLGIHGFWESRIPELYGDGFDFYTGRAEYIERPLDMAWNIVKTSHAEVDTVLDVEYDLNLKFPSDQKYSFVEKAGAITKTYSEAYSKAYNTLLNNMAERKMQAAIKAVSSYWYTAWVNAGQPDLASLKHLSDAEIKEGNSTIVKSPKEHND